MATTLLLSAGTLSLIQEHRDQRVPFHSDAVADRQADGCSNSREGSRIKEIECALSHCEIEQPMRAEAPIKNDRASSPAPSRI